ncbi:MAG: glycosyltransferase family 2 protein [Desulfuromonadaceae bacterium]|nr:glycosyltransferase family 2 protein [Desulfuromonadaceae bacterium]
MVSFSIIIPVKPGGHVAAINHLAMVMREDHPYEILLAEGSAPSQQRNRAAQAACGDILYFLDDDSLVSPGNIDICSARMNDPNVAAVGGPSITPESDSWLQQLFGAALASVFGTGVVSNRYRAYGETRETTDKELILCNLAIRRSVFIALGGFNERLYPNEENEFLERVISSGYTVLHDPSMFVYRSQRRTLRAFIRQMFAYGRGRGQQTLITSSYSISSFIPLFFVGYLILVPLGIKYVLLLAPLVIYLCAALFSSILVLFKSGRLCSLLLLCIYPLMHVVNGVGLLWGLTHGTPEPVSDSSLRITKITSIGDQLLAERSSGCLRS